MDEQGFDEARLRRALRLESAELPPRLDPAVVIARAQASGPAAVLADLASALLSGVSAASLVALAAFALPVLAAVVVTDLLTAALGFVVAVAVPAGAVLDLALQPSIPVAALTALVLAVAYEYRQRRERVDAINAS